MPLDNRCAKRDSARIVLDPPTFSPPEEMRTGYLGKRKHELDAILFQAKENDWKSVMVTINHVRGSGAMYGFEAIGGAADDVAKAVQNGEKDKSLELLHAYADAVNNSNV